MSCSHRIIFISNLALFFHNLIFAQTIYPPVDVWKVSGELEAPSFTGIGLNPTFDITSDSGRIAYIAKQRSEQYVDLLAVPYGGGPYTVLNPTMALDRKVGSFVLSPDGQNVIYQTDYGSPLTYYSLFTVPIAGGTSSNISGSYRVSLYDITPDGNRVLFVEAGLNKLYSVSAGGGAITFLADGIGNWLLQRAWTVSPDSSRVVFTSDAENSNVDELYSVPTAGGTVIKLHPDITSSQNEVDPPAAISRDSSTVVFMGSIRSNNLQEIFSVSILGGALTPLNPALASNQDVSNFKLSPDGTGVLFSVETSGVFEEALYLGDVSGTAPAMISTNGSFEFAPDNFQFSPDGKSIAFLAEDRIDGLQELFWMPVTGSSPVVLSPPSIAGEVKEFKFIPNSQDIVYTATQDAYNRTDLYVVRTAEGTIHSLSDLTLAWTDVNAFEISSNGQICVFVSDRDTPGQFEAYAVSLTESNAVPLKLSPPLIPEGDVIYGTGVLQISPDSSFVVYAADATDDGNVELYATPLPSGAPIRLTGDMPTAGDVKDFTRDTSGRFCAYIANQRFRKVTDVYVTDLLTGKSTLADGYQEVPDEYTGVNAGTADVKELIPAGDFTVYRYVTGTAGKGGIKSLHIPSGKVHVIQDPPIDGSDGAAKFSVSSDNQKVVYWGKYELFEPRELRFNSITGGVPTIVVRDDELSSYFCISPNSDGVAYTTGFSSYASNSIFYVDFALTQTNRLHDFASGIAPDYFITQDGNYVVLRQGYAGGNSYTNLFSLPTTGGSPIALNSVPGTVGSFTYSEATERVLFKIDGQLYSCPISGGSSTLLNHALPYPYSSIPSFELSPDGSNVTYYFDGALFEVPVSGGTANEITPPSVTSFQTLAPYGYTPDSQFVLYEAELNNGDSQLYKSDRQTNLAMPVSFRSETNGIGLIGSITSASRITSTDSKLEHNFSPDGNYVLTSVFHPDLSLYWLVLFDLDGTGAHQLSHPLPIGGRMQMPDGNPIWNAQDYIWHPNSKSLLIQGELEVAGRSELFQVMTEEGAADSYVLPVSNIDDSHGELTFRAFNEKSYNLLRSTNLSTGFEVIASGLTSTSAFYTFSLTNLANDSNVEFFATEEE